MSKQLLVKKEEQNIPELSQEIPANGIITVGSDPASTLVLQDSAVSNEQFVIVCEENKMTLLSRADGTTVNGEPLPQGALHELQIGDEVSVCGFVIEAQSDEPGSGKKKKAKPKKSKVSNGNSESANGEADDDSSDKFQSSLSDVLAGLRTEEKFYFQITNAIGETNRFYVESEEMILGWNPEGLCYLASEEDEAVIPQSIIRKDWTGVVLSPLKPKTVWVNDEPVADSRRLKNDDRITIAEKDSKKPSPVSIIKFHEPTALLVLDSILPKELPPPILIDEQAKSLNLENRGGLDDPQTIHSSQAPGQGVRSRQKLLFFGYFTLKEMIVMSLGTLVTAAIVFLILEFY